jgi:hypothetical protein
MSEEGESSQESKGRTRQPFFASADKEANMEETVDRIEDCDGKQSDCLIQRVCDLVSKMHQVLAKKILQNKGEQNLTDYRCPACVIALFLMASESFTDTRKNPMRKKEFHEANESVKAYYRDAYKTIDLDNIQWDPEKSSQTESNLWTLAAMREVGDNISYIFADQRFLDCIEGLKCQNSPVLGLLLWLFPEFEFEELQMHVEKITRDNYAWLTRDKILFWLTYLRDSRFKEIASRVINERILSLQLDTGAFATVEGKEEKGDLISSAIGLLALISCVKHDNSKYSLREERLKTVRWIIDHPAVKRYLVDELPSEEKCIDMLDRVWVFYALSQYMILNG